MRLAPRTLRSRLALIFAVVTVAVAGLVAGFVLQRYRSDLRNQVDESLEARFGEVRNAVRAATPRLANSSPSIIPKAEGFAQVLARDGSIITGSPRALLTEPLIGPHQLATAFRREHTIERAAPPHGEHVRLLAGSARLGSPPLGNRVVVVVGSSLRESDQARSQLELALATALPALALIVIAAGWLLVGAALRPVRAMVSEADDLSIRRPGQRLSVRGPTEVAELAERLNEMIGRIEAALDRERRFLDDASHELRTPIAIARGELELAQPGAVDVPEVRAALDSAIEEVARLESLSMNLLILARARAGGPPGEDTVTLRAVCERAVGDVRRTSDRDDVRIDVAGSATTTGDAIALERAVKNLVENAVRHAERAVEVTVSERDAEAVVEIHDDGPGFPPAILERVGERFVPGIEGGVGLGLAIVDAIVRSHGGHLEIDQGPGPGPGATIRLRVPAAR